MHYMCVYYVQIVSTVSTYIALNVLEILMTVLIYIVFNGMVAKPQILAF